MFATRDNWRTPPHSIWAFQNLDRLLPVAAVPRGGTERALQSDAVDLTGLRFDDGSGGTIDWPGFLAATHVDAMIVLHRGCIAFEHYANGMAPTSRHMLFSVTKSVVGLLAEILAADGRLDLDAEAAVIVPELAGTAFGNATLRTLLDMRDGVPFDENYADPSADIHRYSQAYWGDDGRGVRGVLRRLATRPAGNGDFVYRTPIADVVGWAVERAAGCGLPELLARRLWQPMGAAAEAYLVLDNAGDAIAGAGLNATLRDIARLGQLLLDGGRRDDVAVIPSAAVASVAGGGDAAAFAAAAPPTRRGWSYRSFWWATHDVHDGYGAFGVFGQRLVIRPRSQTVIVRFGSHPVAANAPTDAIHAAAFAALETRLAVPDAAADV